jgi:hypothetical protein
MRRCASAMLAVGLSAGLIACGAPQGASSSPTAQAFPAPRLQPISFTGFADPITGQLQVLVAPHAALATIPESADGNVLTVAPDSVQVYGASVSYASNPALYPATCNPAAPLVMTADVEVFSGFTEQLRNVYARMTTVSSGSSFCAPTTPPIAFANELGGNFGLYLYQPLDAGPTPSAIKRNVQWAINLPDNSAFWFTGEIWAEVIPGPLTGFSPPSGTPFAAPGNSEKARVTFSWTKDALADGQNPEGFVVPRPLGSAQYLIKRCNTQVVAGDPVIDAQCTVDVAANDAEESPLTISLPAIAPGVWYRFQARPSFTIGAAPTRSFASSWSTTIYVLVTP